MKINLTIEGKAESQLIEILYSLPKNSDGTGICSKKQALEYALECLYDFEEQMGVDIQTFLADQIKSTCE